MKIFMKKQKQFCKTKNFFARHFGALFGAHSGAPFGAPLGAKIYFYFCAAFLLAGCQSSSTVDDILAGRKIDYQTETTAQRALQYPPDLIAGGGAPDAVSLSEYSIAALPDVGEGAEDGAAFLAAEVAYNRDGRARWIAVQRPPSALWGQVADFWNDEMNLPVIKENEAAGIMETGWLDLRRGEIEEDGAFKQLDQFLGVLRDSGNRDKFITRLEGNDAGGTDVFISHRHVVARIDEESGALFGYEPAASAVELEVEMMRRMMVYLAVAESAEGAEDAGEVSEEAAAIDAEVAAAEAADESETYTLAGAELLIRKPFFDSWRLVQIALDRGGFTIEDRDYDNGWVFIQHSGGPESDQIFGKKSEGFFAGLFGGDAPAVRDIQLTLAETDGETLVTAAAAPVEAAEGEETPPQPEPLSEEQQAAVLNLLYERLP